MSQQPTTLLFRDILRQLCPPGGTKMTALPLRINNSLHVLQRDFGAQLHGDLLEVPECLAVALAKRKVRSALQFVNLLCTSPSAIARDLGWDVGDVEAARVKLVSQLNGKLPFELLHPPEREHPSGGVTNPHVPESRSGDLGRLK